MLDTKIAAPANGRPRISYRAGALEEHLSGSVLLKSFIGVSAPKQPKSVLFSNWLLRSRVGLSPKFTLVWRSPPSRPRWIALLPNKARCIIKQ